MSAQMKNEIQRALSQANRELTKIVAETTGANSEPVKQMAFTLARAWRRRLNVSGDPTNRSSPGEAPRSISKRLRKSIKTAVVEGIRRVGTNDFRARLFEFGGYLSRGGVPQPPRPHAQVSLEEVKDQMVEVMVTNVQTIVTKGAR